MKIVCNTSPLILLAKIGRLDTLIRLYREPMIPKAVEDELSAKPGQENDQIQAVLKEGKLQLRRVAERTLAGIPVDLGRGEREAIALALDKDRETIISYGASLRITSLKKRFFLADKKIKSICWRLKDISKSNCFAQDFFGKLSQTKK